MCVSLCTPWTVAHQSPQFMGFSRQQHWSRWSFPSPGDRSDPRGIKLGSPTLQEDSLPAEPPGKPIAECLPNFHLGAGSILDSVALVLHPVVEGGPREASLQSSTGRVSAEPLAPGLSGTAWPTPPNTTRRPRGATSTPQGSTSRTETGARGARKTKQTRIAFRGSAIQASLELQSIK